MPAVQVSCPRDAGEARGAVLSVKLDQMSDSVAGQTVVDPKGPLGVVVWGGLGLG